MPAYNEAEGITSFMRDIHQNFLDVDHLLVVVDDCSSDNTSEIVRGLKKGNLPAELVVHDTNQGHGPATLTALGAAMNANAQWVVTADGDGQISGLDLRRVFDAGRNSPSGYAEGVRTQRSDPWFRKLVSIGTRILVWARCGVAPRDANTPFRAYSKERLEEVLVTLHRGSETPNLSVSALARRRKWAIAEVPFTSLPRRGLAVGGSTWNQKNTFLPSKRFVQFCGQAFAEWLGLRKRRSL